MSIADMMSAINSKSQQKSYEFRIKNGEKTPIRFVADGDTVLNIIVHGRFIQGDFKHGYTVPCPIAYGHPSCPLDGLEDKEGDEGDNRRSTIEKWCFIIYDYRDNLVKILAHNATRASALPHIGEAFSTYGTLLGRDFVIGKSIKSGRDTTHTLMPRDKSQLEQSVIAEIKRQLTYPGRDGKMQTVDLKDKVSVHQFIKYALASTWCPEVLKTPLALPAGYLKEMSEIRSMSNGRSMADVFSSNGHQSSSLDDEMLPGDSEYNLSDVEGLV